jgi:hypothetical protein
LGNLEALTTKRLEFALPDGSKTHPVADLKREIGIGEVDDFQRSLADEAPASGSFERIDSRLPARQPHTPSGHPSTGRRATWETAQRWREVAQVGEAGDEADRIDRVFGAAVPGDNFRRSESSGLGHQGQIRSEFVAAGNLVESADEFGR